jgi:hypothetical protein
MSTLMRAVAVLLVVAIHLAAADSPAEQDWSKVKNTTEMTELEEFIAKYPDSKFAALASRRMDELAWQKVDKSDPNAVLHFLRTHADFKADEPAQRPGRAASAASATDGRAVSPIDRALQSLAEAYQRRSVEELRRVWPTIPANTLKLVERTFREAWEIRMELTPGNDPVMDGDKAIVICRQKLDTVYKGNRSNPTESLITVHLQRIGPGWVIEKIN